MKILIYLMFLVVLLSSGCAVTEGPRPPKHNWKISQSDVNDMADCEAKYPNAKSIWDPFTNYYAYEGDDAENIRRCLVEKHGWFKLGPPEFTDGTMAPPRKLLQ